MNSKFSTNIRFIREIPRYNSRWLRVTKQQHHIANLFVSRAHKFRYVQNSIATLLFSIVVADHCDRWIIYRSRFSTHTLVEKKKEKRRKKKRIVDRLFNFKANYRAPRINFEFLTFQIRKTDTEIYEPFMLDRFLLEFRGKKGVASIYIFNSFDFIEIVFEQLKEDEQVMKLFIDE